ncbi:MAG: SRPBCC family protein [Acidimicrobiales bacterium]
MEGHVISVERVIAAPASDLFRIVADANRHPEIDGSGSVVRAKPGTPQVLALGSTFGMSMKVGIPYSMSNTVIEFEQDRRIAWKTVAPGFLGRFLGGRIWRYEFEPVEGGTLVRESWDLSQDRQAALLKLGKMPSATAEGMTKTLARLANVAETPPAE